MNAVEFVTDGRTVWVNSADGCCLGRFGPRGVDVHKSAHEQMETGEQCLGCFVRSDDPQADWGRFRGLMLTHHRVSVPAALKPAGAPS